MPRACGILMHCALSALCVRPLKGFFLVGPREAWQSRGRTIMSAGIFEGDDIMAEHHTGPAEVGAAMDYKEHENTYNMFLAATKYGTLFLVALLLGMAAGFFAGAGLLGGLVVLLIVFIAGIVMLR
jgi:hypothetical protein